MVANLRYFQDAIKRHGVPGSASNLLTRYQTATKGLDSGLAFKALSGGRVFGDSDRKRYQDLLNKRRQASKPKPTVKPAPKPKSIKGDGTKSDAKVDLKTFQSLLSRLEASKKRQQRQQSVEGRRDIYAGGMASMMNNF